jgi:hypothetical protein
MSIPMSMSTSIKCKCQRHCHCQYQCPCPCCESLSMAMFIPCHDQCLCLCNNVHVQYATPIKTILFTKIAIWGCNLWAPNVIFSQFELPTQATLKTAYGLICGEILVSSNRSCLLSKHHKFYVDLKNVHLP